MRLKKTSKQASILGLPPSRLEWWDLGEGYEIYVDLGVQDGEYVSCSIGVHSPFDTIHDPGLTYKIAPYLGVDTDVKKLVSGERGDEELYLTMGIDCVVLNYTKPKKYKTLLERIEKIVNEHFKGKEKPKKEKPFWG
jgi:hypothetical protein